ncbi:MAG: hypothetical protein AAFV51_13930, partial [Pseudomonadota bacterium]
GSGDVKLIWTVLQWVTTSYLWVTWLTVSLDDIFIFLPTSMSVAEGGLAIFVTALLLALTFANQGGEGLGLRAPVREGAFEGGGEGGLRLPVETRPARGRPAEARKGREGDGLAASRQ